MIDTVNANKVLENCKYYDDIINYDIDCYDEISYDLIDWYKDVIFSCNGEDNDEMLMVKLLDKCIYCYITDYKYQKGLKRIINVRDIDLNSKRKVRKLVKLIFNYHKNYENNSLFNIYVGKWI